MTTTPAALTPPPPAPTVSQAATGLAGSVLSALAATFGATGGPGAPVQSPGAWVMLAAARREVGSLLTGDAPVDTTAALTTGQTARVVTAAAAAAVVNAPPVIGDPLLIGLPDPTTGTVTAKVNASDPEGKKLTYTLTTSPTEGKLVFNKTTGDFTYTPTAAQRVIAQVTAGDQVASFTVTVSDGVKANNVVATINVKIDPTTITNLGVISTGTDAGANWVAATDTRAYVANANTKTISVIDTINRVKIADIALPNTPFDVVVSPDGKKLYVVDEETTNITVIDATTNALAAPITLGANRVPVLVAVSPDGKTLYATTIVTDAKTGVETAAVSKVSTATGKVTGTVKLPGAIASFYDIEVSRDGKKVFVIADIPADDPDAEYDRSGLYAFASAASTATLIGKADYLASVTVSPDGSRLYIADNANGEVAVQDAKTYAVLGIISTGGAPMDVQINGDGTVLAVFDEAVGDVKFYDTRAPGYALLTTVSTDATFANFFPQAFLSPDGMELYFNSDAGLQVISLVPANQKPITGTVTTGTPDTTGAVTGTVGVTDPDADKLTYTATSPVNGGKVVINPNGSFTYTPSALARHNAAAAPLTDSFTVTVSDGRRGFVTQTITIDIAPANQAPTVKASVPNPNSTTGVVKGSIIGSDKDKDVLTYTSTTPAKGTVTVDAKGVFTYVPTAQARHDAAATTATAADKADTFTVTVDDGHGGTSTVTVSVKISPKNVKPTNGSAVVTQPNTTTGVVTGSVTATDLDNDGFTLTGPATTKKGSISYDSATDTFTYTASAAARAAAAAPKASAASKIDQFTVTINDGHGGTTTAAVTVTIAPNAAPVAGGSTAGTLGPTMGIVSGSVTATDPDGDTVSYAVTKPLDTKIGVIAVDSATGAWQFKPTGEARYDAFFTPTADTAKFSITAFDGRGATTVIAVTATVDPAVDLYYDKVFSTGGGTTAGIAVAADGRIYVTDQNYESPRGVTVLNADGTIAKTVSLNGESSWGVAIGPDGRVYATSNGATGGKVWVVNPADDYAATVFATVADDPTAIAFNSAGKLYVATSNYDKGTGKVSILNTAGVITSTQTFSGVVSGLAFGSGNRLFVTVSSVDTTKGALVIVNANNSRKTIQLGSAALGVAVDSSGRAYVTTFSAADVDDNAPRLVIVNPDYSVTSPITLGNKVWIGLTTAPDGGIWGTDTADNTANLISIDTVWDGPYDFTNEDPASGIITGNLSVLDPGHHNVYSLTTPVDPALGVVAVDPSTGNWVFTPTVQARLAATAAGEDTWTTFTITGSYGTTVTPVVVEVYIAQLIDVDYQTSVIGGLAFQPGAITTMADGRLVVTTFSTTPGVTGSEVRVVDTDGTVVSTRTLPGTAIGVAVRPDGRAYVADYDIATNGINGTISTVDLNGGANPVLFARTPGITDFALGADGRLYVSSFGSVAGTGRVTVFDAAGTVVRVIDVGSPSFGVAVGPDGRVYVSTSGQEGGGLVSYAADGTNLTPIDVGSARPQRLAVASDGTLFVADSSNSQVLVIKPNGSTTTIKLDAAPFGITVGQDGRVYVTSLNGAGITVLTAVPAGQSVEL